MSNYTTSIPWSQTAAGKRCLSGLEERKNQATTQSRLLTQDDNYPRSKTVTIISTDNDLKKVIDNYHDNDRPIVKNPDGQDHLIRGQYAEALKNDPHLLQARAWGVYPGILTAAIKRLGLEWTQKQVQYVKANIKSNHGPYLARILKHNKY